MCRVERNSLYLHFHAGSGTRAARAKKEEVSPSRSFLRIL
jgi:hypothetical protein